MYVYVVRVSLLVVGQLLPPFSHPLCELVRADVFPSGKNILQAVNFLEAFEAPRPAHEKMRELRKTWLRKRPPVRGKHACFRQLTGKPP